MILQHSLAGYAKTPFNQHINAKTRLVTVGPGTGDAQPLISAPDPIPFMPIALDFRIDFHKDSQLRIVSISRGPLLTCSLTSASLYASGISQHLASEQGQAQTLRAGFELTGGLVVLPGTSGAASWKAASLEMLDFSFRQQMVSQPETQSMGTFCPSPLPTTHKLGYLPNVMHHRHQFYSFRARWGSSS